MRAFALQRLNLRATTGKAPHMAPPLRTPRRRRKPICRSAYC